MRINTNVSAIVSNNALQKAQNALSTSIARLSSGYKINSSEDDPAGCAISEKMRVQIRGLDQSNNNTADGVSVVNTAEGAISEIQSMLTRMKELTVQAANDVNSDSERLAIQQEIDNINQEIDRISDQTEFNTQPLINGNLSRRVYSDYQGVNQLSVSDGFVAGNYGVTIKQDARQAVAVGDTITMSSTATVAKDEAGTITLNGYIIDINEGDNLDTIMGKLVDGANLTGGKAFTISDTTNDTKANGTEYAGYNVSTTYSGSKLVIMTNQYGRDQKMDIKCSNEKLAGLLGIPDAYSEDGSGIHAEGSDVIADFAEAKDASGNPTGERVGFEKSAVLSTKGTKITIKDVNNKEFIMDIPGNVAGTTFNDSVGSKVNGKSVAGASTQTDITQEVTDVGTMSIHVGANENQVIILDIPELSTYTLETDHLNVMTGYTAQLAIDTVDNAIAYANAARSKLGAYSNRFEHTTNNIEVSSENLTSALSTMIDTDMAEEMTEYTSQTVLTQAATSILSQANQRPAEVLQLLQF
ncbi:MAG: flagellin [Eubacteriales bacterium]|nr:flagellin [Eubacteriales bacterium]